MSFNLIDQISIEDKKKIENYISLYGVKDGFIGLDSWLKPWSDNKIKMYKMLGNQLIYKTPFEYNKSQADLKYQLRTLVNSYNLQDEIIDWFYDNRNAFYDSNDFYDSNEEGTIIRGFICNCLYPETLLKDSIDFSFKFKLKDSNKTFQLQRGAKPLRALGRFLTYCKNINGIDEINKKYEKFRIAHSMIFNDKTVKGTLAISIHPLDFMTMSDNNSNWHSCMSWMNEGCYHVGTVEMMNSNNVLCCYIENSEPFYFSKGEEKDEEYRWANKKWRQLIYFTKDIIVSGKPYPYTNDEFSKTIIETIRGLAKENLKWTYSFGPELYRDMIHINGNYSINRAKRYIANKNTTKFNIIFDTKGMYNDMLNDSDTNYWCVRNKVKHTKVISYSGKASCLCCGNSVLSEGEDPEDDYSDYNERYNNVGEVICEECLEKFKCNICGYTDPIKRHIPIIIEGKEYYTCEKCASKYIKLCPECEKPMLIPFFEGLYDFLYRSDETRQFEFITLKNVIDTDELRFHGQYWEDDCSDKNYVNTKFKTVYPICRCKNCAEKDKKNFIPKNIKKDSFWYTPRKETFLVSKEIQNKVDWKKYFFYNLKKADVKDYINISR